MIDEHKFTFKIEYNTVGVKQNNGKCEISARADNPINAIMKIIKTNCHPQLSINEFVHINSIKLL